MNEPSGPLRRSFLGAAGLAAAAALPDVAAGAQAGAAGGAPTAFTHWLDGIGGKQRQLFDVTEPNQGFGLLWAWAFLLTGPEAYGLPEKELGVVIVLRHGGLPLALTDAVWRKYHLGEMFHLTDPATKAPATRNYFVNSRPGDMLVPEASLDRLIARGAKVGACNLALTVYSGMAAKRIGRPAEAVKQEWLAGLVPGVQMVPSGIVAVNGAQSRGCAYCFAG